MLGANLVCFQVSCPSFDLYSASFNLRVFVIPLFLDLLLLETFYLDVHPSLRLRDNIKGYRC